MSLFGEDDITRLLDSLPVARIAESGPAWNSGDIKGNVSEHVLYNVSGGYWTSFYHARRENGIHPAPKSKSTIRENAVRLNVSFNGTNER